MNTDLTTLLPALIQHHLPDRAVIRVQDRGEWVRRIFEVSLEDGQTVFIKFETHPEYLDATVHSRVVCDLLHDRGLSTTAFIAVDDTKTLAPYPYAIERKMRGTRLDRLLKTGLSTTVRAEVIQAVGRYYRAMHSICGPKHGVWIANPAQPFDITPTEFFLKNEFETGAGRELVEAGRLSEGLWRRAVHLWRTCMPEIDAQPPVMVHGSPFRWTIYLTQEPDGWRVSELASLGDVLWWDCASDLAAFRFPPFAEESGADWQAFLAGYGPLPEGAQRRIQLHTLLHNLMACAGHFFEPHAPECELWKARTMGEIERLLDEIAA